MQPGHPPCGQPAFEAGPGFLPRCGGDGTIDAESAIDARKQMGIDALGLDELDRGVLRAIIELYGGGPVGLDTLAAALGEEERHTGGCLRALPDADGISHPYPAGEMCHPAGVRASAHGSAQGTAQ